MKSNIFLPKKIKVGFQERDNTYTGKLAYVTYYDNKNVLRKEKSWEGWRHKDIEPMDLDNEPTSGFVLNKKVGGYSTGWNHRQTYCRIYDPRGFEFEIDIVNLLYILENTTCVPGKGLEGEFVYGWNGTQLILIPTSSPDYKEIQEFNSILQNNTHVTAKQLKIGAIYKNKQNEEIMYMGQFDRYSSYYYCGNNNHEETNNDGKHFYFVDTKYIGQENVCFEQYKTLGDKIIATVSEDCHPNYSDMFEKLEHCSDYSPIDSSKDEHISYTLEEFTKYIEEENYYCRVMSYDNDVQNIGNYNCEKNGYISYWNGKDYSKESIENVFNKLKPKYINKYLKNGKFYKKQF